MSLGQIKVEIGIAIAKNFNAQLSKIERKLSKSASKFNDIGQSISIGISAPLGLLGSQAITTAAEFETLQSSLSVLTGSADKGAEAFERLKKFSAQTPFQLQDLVRANNTLMGFGMNSDAAFKSLEQLGDIAAVMGSDLNSMSVAFGQSAASGVAMTADINQFINQGVPLYKLLEELTDKSTAELKEMASQGEITFPLIQEALKKATSEGGMFFDGMNKGSQTLGGVLSTFRDRLSLALGTLGNAIAESINFKQVVKTLGDAVQKAANFFANLGDGTKKFIVIVVGAVAALGPLMFAMGGILNVVQSLIPAIKLLNNTFIGFLANPITIVIASMVALAVAITKLVKQSKFFQENIQRVSDLLKNTFSKILNTINQLFGILANTFGEVTGTTITFKDIIGALSETLGKAFIKALEFVNKALVFLANAFIDAYNESAVFRGIIFGLTNAFKTFFNTAFEGISSLGKSLKALFSRDFKEAAKAAKDGALKIASLGFETAKGFAEGFVKGVKSREKLTFEELIAPKDKIIEESQKAGEKAAKAFKEGLAQGQKREDTQTAALPTKVFNQQFATSTPTLDPVELKKDAEVVKRTYTEVINDLGSVFSKFNMKLASSITNLANTLFETIGTKIPQALVMGLSSVIGAFEMFGQAQQERDQQRLEALEAKYNREKELIQKTTQNEDIKKRKLFKLDQENERKKAEIQKRIAKRNKASAIFEAIINGAASIAKVAYNPFMVALTTALVASQVAAISAQPMPFANGGIVSGEVIGRVGEYMGARNNPEVIAPLNKLKQMIDPKTNINLNGSFVLSGDDLILAVENANRTNSRFSSNSTF